MVISVVVAGIAVILAAAEGVEALVLGVIFAAAFLAPFSTLSYIGWHVGRRPRAYGITDRRLLVFDGASVHGFAPDEVSTFDFDQHPDGSVDLFWGRRARKPRERRREPEGGGKTRLEVRTRAHRVGFVGLRAAEPAQTLLRDWLKRHQRAVASASPANEKPGLAAFGSGALEDWQTVREPQSGLSINLPQAWQVRVGRINRTRLLGIRFESPEPSWFATLDQAGWNRLEAFPGVAGALLRIDLDSGSVPRDLEAVLSDRWAKLANIKVIKTLPDLQTNGLSGFGVVHELKGGRTPATDQDIAGNIELLQTQRWLAQGSHTVHILSTVPPEGNALHDAIERAVATVRLTP